MPVMDGFDSGEQILKLRADNPQFFPQIKTTIIALTSYTDLSSRKRCLDLGFKEVINKPINADELKRIIAQYHFDIQIDKYNEYLLALKEQKEANQNEIKL